MGCVPAIALVPRWPPPSPLSVAPALAPLAPAMDRLMAELRAYQGVAEQVAADPPMMELHCAGWRCSPLDCVACVEDSFLIASQVELIGIERYGRVINRDLLWKYWYHMPEVWGRVKAAIALGALPAEQVAAM